LIAYLLHRMPDDARAAFAERWLAEPGLHEQLRMVEAELLDAYARGELSADDRQSIERHLLHSQHQREKLAFAEVLATRLSGARRPRRRTWLTPLAAAAVITLLAGTITWLASQNQALRHQLESVRPQPVRSASGTILIVSLPADALRDGASDERRLVLPREAEQVRLDLELESSGGADEYAVEVSTLGRRVWRAEPIRPSRRGAASVAPVWVPASVLQPGRYEVMLALRGQPLAYYHLLIAAQ
jgi:hypothetical protein